jgi:hypothetical protein
MTWKLVHDGEVVGEWSDDLIDKVVKKLMNTNTKLSTFADGTKADIFAHLHVFCSYY